MSEHEQRQRERDLVLAPNEYAYISDETKGNIVVYVGPNKTSLANTDQPVYFNADDKRFCKCSLERAVKQWCIAPEGWYIVLKNPADTEQQPSSGAASNIPKLQLGQKVNTKGPVSMPLWPGQMAKVRKGHHLRSNQYLVARVYNEEAARESWHEAIVKPQKSADNEDPEQTPIELEMPELTMGKLIVITGTDVSFYIPPTGIEVLEEDGKFVRDAVTLERLDYCVLLDENGNKRFVRGPDVVFPQPTEQFLLRTRENGKKTRKFRAIELNPQMGLHIKVIADYDEYTAGDELFITGDTCRIYYPREEHAILSYGDSQVHYATAIPAGEARYVLNKNTGDVDLVRGPTMYLQDPRKEVIIQRILDPRRCELMYPGNADALEYNLKLAQQSNPLDLRPDMKDFHSNRYAAASAFSNSVAYASTGITKSSLMEHGGEEILARGIPETPKIEGVTLDTKYEGAVTVSIWSGYAVQVVSKSGERRVVKGPQTVLLEYDEDLEILELSTGTPKTDKRRKRTVYLRYSNNKVSDVIYAETKDLVEVEVEVSYRVNFEGDENQWFAVENYVKFLTDHLRSMIRNAVKRVGVEDFNTDPITLVRDTVLGTASGDGRPGRQFSENNMLVYDVEVLGIKIGDKEIATMLVETSHENVRNTLQLVRRRRDLEVTQGIEQIDRQISEEQTETAVLRAELRKREITARLSQDLEDILAEISRNEQRLVAKVEEQKHRDQLHAADLNRRLADQENEISYAKERQALEIADLEARRDAWVARAQAITPHLIDAMRSFSDKDMAARVGEALGPMKLMGGKSAAEILNNIFKGTRLANIATAEIDDEPKKLESGESS